mmetsp:Transcript_18842/g.36302  ORF Transcript_18842/g.36302 Transcript_18842/m.36302 type:complete len:241 (-) Transcript_18842:574-1296(-)
MYTIHGLLLLGPVRDLRGGVASAGGTSSSFSLAIGGGAGGGAASSQSESDSQPRMRGVSGHERGSRFLWPLRSLPRQGTPRREGARARAATHESTESSTFSGMCWLTESLRFMPLLLLLLTEWKAEPLPGCETPVVGSRTKRRRGEETRLRAATMALRARGGHSEGHLRLTHCELCGESVGICMARATEPRLVQRGVLWQNMLVGRKMMDEAAVPRALKAASMRVTELARQYIYRILATL